MIKPLQPGFRPWVNRPTALRAMEIPPCPLRGTSPRESVSRNFRLPCGPLQISFACHPASGGRITRAYGRVAYEEIAFQSFIVPPLSGGRWCRKAPNPHALRRHYERKRAFDTMKTGGGQSVPLLGLELAHQTVSASSFEPHFVNGLCR